LGDEYGSLVRVVCYGVGGEAGVYVYGDVVVVALLEGVFPFGYGGEPVGGVPVDLFAVCFDEGVACVDDAGSGVEFAFFEVEAAADEPFPGSPGGCGEVGVAVREFEDERPAGVENTAEFGEDALVSGLVEVAE